MENDTKTKNTNKTNNISKIIGIIFIIICVILGIFLSHNTETTAKELKIYYFNIGETDCTLIICEGETMLIDGGNLKDDDGNEIVTSDNNTSIVIQLDYKNISCLFMGDSEDEVEKSITWNDVDILKVAHHGSDSSTTLEFLYQVKPEYSIISVGNNSYGHPTNTVLSNLATVNSTVYRTDENGTIILISDETKYYFEFDDTVLDGN